MENPFLSIIIPVFNAERFLTKCIDSVIQAQIPKVELILVDDGSSDNSPEICRSYSEQYPFISYIRQENSGPSAARNKGIESVKGEYIAFFDADDYVESSDFANYVDAMQKCSADMWASDFRRVADNGCVLDEVFQIDETNEPISSREYIFQFLSARDCVWNVWRYIFRRSFVEDKQLRFAEGFNIAEDLEFVVRAISVAESICFLHLPYYFYRVNYGQSLTRCYTVRRVEQLMQMFAAANGHLGDRASDLLLKQKLAREYILNLSLLWEVPKRERKQALSALTAAKPLSCSASGIYTAAAIAVKVLGIPVCAGMLYCAKSVKRLVRKVKTDLFTGGKNA